MRFDEQTIAAKKKFIMVPMDLFDNEQYRDISLTACMVYGKLYSLTKLSGKNSWTDDNGKIFCRCTLSLLAEFFGFSESTASRALNELAEHNLLERIKKGRGRADLLYLHDTAPETENDSISSNCSADAEDNYHDYSRNDSDLNDFNFTCTDESGVISLADMQIKNVPAIYTASWDILTCTPDIGNHHPCKSSLADMQAKYKKIKEINNISSTQDNIYLYKINSTKLSNCQEIIDDSSNFFVDRDSGASDAQNAADFSGELEAIGLSAPAVDKLLKSYPQQKLRICMDCLYTKLANGTTIRNPAGMFMYMIKNDVTGIKSLTPQQARSKLSHLLSEKLQELGFSKIISNIMVELVNKRERFSYTEKNACIEIGLLPEVVYDAIQTHNFSACICRC